MTSDMERFEAEQERAVQNTDRELWRGPDEGNGDYYADSIHVTEGGGIGINCGGHVIVMPLRDWFALASVSPHHTPEAGILSEALIEKTARALCRVTIDRNLVVEAKTKTEEWKKKCEDYCWVAHRELADVALTAALPGIVEALKPFVDCADSFDNYPIKDATGWGIWSMTNNDPKFPPKRITVADLRRLREVARSLTHTSKGE
jgi:hypothetical protein